MKYAKELDFAKQLALKAGKIMLAGLTKSKTTLKSDLSPVTETDLAISTLVIAEVKKHFPKHDVLDEEFQKVPTDNEFIWVCDPIDGTVPFSNHIPTSMFSLALCYQKEPVVAVVYDPYMKRLLYTSRGEHSFMNDKVIRVKDGKFNVGDIIYGFPIWSGGFDLTKYISLLYAKKIRISYIESIVYQSMLVALGSTRAMVTEAANPWDRAAAILIIENAGGTCTDEKGNKLTVFGNPRLFIASNGTVHNDILDIVEKCII